MEESDTFSTALSQVGRPLDGQRGLYTPLSLGIFHYWEPSSRRIPSFSIPPELIASSPEEISFAIDPFEAFSITAHNSSPGFALSPLDPLPEDSTL